MISWFHNNSNRWRLFYRIVVFFSIIIVGCIAAIGIEINNRYGELKQAQLDNVTWTIAQLEVDYLKLLREIHSVKNDIKQKKIYNSEKLRLLNFFDIYYSRVQTLSAGFSQQGNTRIFSDEAKSKWIPVITQRQYLTQEFDSKEEWTEVKLSHILKSLEDGAGSVRQFVVEALHDVTVLTTAKTQRSEDFIQLFIISASITMPFLIFLVAISGWLSTRIIEGSKELEHVMTTLEVTVNASQEAILIIDSSMCVISCNNAAENLLYLDTREIVNKYIYDILVDTRGRDEIVKLFSNLETLYREGLENKAVGRLNCIRKCGDKFDAEVSLVSETESSGKQIFICFVRNITSQLRSEKILKEAKITAENIAQSKSRFVALASHELRTPIHSIRASLDILQSSQEFQCEGREMLDVMSISVQSAVEIIDEVLVLAELDNLHANLKIEPFSPDAVISEICLQLSSLADLNNNRIDFKNLWMGSKFINANYKAFRFAVVNIVRNAIKFTKNGHIFIKIGHNINDRDIMQVSIEDTGIGISEEMLGQIFEDFETLQDNDFSNIAGTGLGLGIVKRSVSALNGQVGVDSKLGWGSRFWFEFPTEAAQLPVTTEKKLGPSAPRPYDALLTLVVDDNSANRFIMERMLKKLGHYVEVVDSGKKAVQLVREKRFDLVFMDLNMPDMNGHEATEKIRQYYCRDGVKVVSMTANASLKCASNSQNSVFDGVLIKPFTVEKLKSSIDFMFSSVVFSRNEFSSIPLIDDDNLEILVDTLGFNETCVLFEKSLSDAFSLLADASCETLASPGFVDKLHHVTGPLAFLGARKCQCILNLLENNLRENDIEAASHNIQDAITCLNDLYLHYRGDMNP